MKTRLLKKLRRMADKAVTVKPFVGEIDGRIYEGYIVRWRFNRTKRFTIYDDCESPAIEAILFYIQKRNEFIEKELKKSKNKEATRSMMMGICHKDMKTAEENEGQRMLWAGFIKL